MSVAVSSSASAPLAIVTGAASGIGLEISKLLLRKSYRVIMTDINDVLGQEQATLLGPNATFVHCDASSWDSLSSVFKAAFQEHGRLDLVAVNAGIMELPPKAYGNEDSSDPEEEPVKPNTKVVEVNLIGQAYTVSLAAHYMHRNPAPHRGGKIIVTSSAAGIHPMPWAPLYVASKHGTVGLTRSMAPFLSPEGIYISAIGPAVTDTPMMHAAFSTMPPAVTTTMEVVMRGFETLVDSGIEAAGKVLEVAGDQVVERGLVDETVAAQWIQAAFIMAGKAVPSKD